MKQKNNKLIVLLVLTGSYQGGTQRRYLNLFKFLQEKRDDYFLLINRGLYTSCINDGILTSNKNIVVVNIKFEVLNEEENHGYLESKFDKLNIKKRNVGRLILGRLKSFCKQFFSWGIYNYQLFKVIREKKISVIYGVFTGGMWSWFLSKLLGLKFIYSYNDSGTSLVSCKFLDLFDSEYFVLKNSKKVDFLSEKLLESLSKKAVSIKKSQVLITPNSFIDYTNFYPEYPKRRVVTFLARMTPIKNPELLIEAIKILNKTEIDYETVFIGGGELLNNLKNKIQNYRIKNVSFLGELATPGRILRTSSIFVSIQQKSNYPSQSLLEAMACGNAIVASDVGETNMLISSNEGVLVELDAQQIAKAISYLLDNPEICMTMGGNARRKVLSEHTIEKYYDYFMSITS